MYYLGVDLGGTTIKAGLFDEQLQLLKMVQKNTGASLGADIVLKRIEKCLDRCSRYRSTGFVKSK